MIKKIQSTYNFEKIFLLNFYTNYISLLDLGNRFNQENNVIFFLIFC